MKCFCGVDLVQFNNDNAWKICPACRVEYASGGESLPAIAEKLAEPEDKFFVQVGPVMRYGSGMAQKIMAKAERGDVNALNLIVLDVSEDDDHPAASRVEDESMCIVQVEGHPDRWWPAEEFFLMVDVKKFKVIEGDL